MYYVYMSHILILCIHIYIYVNYIYRLFYLSRSQEFDDPFEILITVGGWLVFHRSTGEVYHLIGDV